jgi:hypothetical protein
MDSSALNIFHRQAPPAARARPGPGYDLLRLRRDKFVLNAFRKLLALGKG